MDGRIWAHGFIFGWLKFKYLVWIVYKGSKIWILTNPPRILNLKILEFEITSKPIEFFRNVQYVIKIKIKKFKKLKNLSSNKEDQPTTGFNH